MTGRALHRKHRHLCLLLPQARPGQSSASSGPGAEGGQRQGSTQTGWEERMAPVHCWLPGLTAEARCGLRGSRLAGLGRSSHPHPSAHLGSSRRWPSQVVPVSLRGLPGDKGSSGDRLWGRLWGVGPRNNREGVGKQKEGRPPQSLPVHTCWGCRRSPPELLW